MLIYVYALVLIKVQKKGKKRKGGKGILDIENSMNKGMEAGSVLGSVGTTGRSVCLESKQRGRR